MSATFHAVGNGEQTSSASSFSITTTISAGDFLVVVSSWDSASTTTPTVATTGGTGSDTGTLILGPITAGSFGLKYGAWLVSSAGSGRTGVTVSWASSSPSFADGYCWSASGLATPTLDKSPNTSGNSTNPSSGSTGTLSTSDQFCVSYAASASVTVGVPGGGFADDGNTGSTGSRAGHQVVAVNTALTGSFTAATSAWAALALTIKSGGAAAAPFYKTDWSMPYNIPEVPARVHVRDPSQFPNPIPFKEQQHRHTQGVKLSVPRDYARDPSRFPNPIPFSQSSWFPAAQPVPSRSQAILNNTILTSVVVSAPFAQLNWIGSSKPRIILTDATDASEMWLFPPFTPVDYSKQFYPTVLPSGIQQTNINLFTNPIPFSTQWAPGTTVQGKASDVVQPWQNFYTIVVSNPFAQYSWVPTQSVKISPPQATPFNSNLFTNPFPFFQTDWSTTKFQTPRAPDASQPLGVSALINSTQFMLLDWSGSGYTIRSNRSFDQPYNQLLYGVVVPATPFTPVDFSRPFAIPPAKVDVQSVNTNLFTNPVPFGPYDWNTSSFFFTSRGKAVPQDLPNLLLIQPSTPSNPLGIFSWADLYKYVTLYPTTPALLQNLTLLLPTPVPPPDIVVGGRSWKWIDGVNELRRQKQTQTQDVKRAAAVLSSMGGHARAESLTSRQRTNIASKAAQARWNPPIKR